MNLYAFRIFYHVAKIGSVTRAAESLLISQPAVTGQIKNLEAELGLTLFASKGRGIRLTEAGELLAEQAERMFSLEAEIERKVEAYKTGKFGAIAIAATYMPANYVLPKWLASFKNQNGAVAVSLRTGNAKEAIEQLMQYKADLAVIGGGVDPHPELERKELFSDEFLFIVPKEHEFAGKEVELARLMRVPFVLRETGSSTREQLMALCHARGIQAPQAALHCNGLHETIRAVMAGYGAAFVSALEAGESIERNEVAQVSIIPYIRIGNPVFLLMRKGDALTPAAQSCADFLLRQSGRHDATDTNQ